MKPLGFIGFTCVFCVASGSLLLSPAAFARSWKTVQREAEARMKAKFGLLSDEQLFEMMEYREKEISDLWPEYTEAYSRLCAALAATGACTNFPMPMGTPTMMYDPVASGHAISPMYLSPGKVYQLSEASPVYRRLMWEIARNRSLAMAAYMKLQTLAYERNVLAWELQRRSAEEAAQ